jgi:hypothetical protein
VSECACVQEKEQLHFGNDKAWGLLGICCSPTKAACDKAAAATKNLLAVGHTEPCQGYGQAPARGKMCECVQALMCHRGRSSDVRHMRELLESSCTPPARKACADSQVFCCVTRGGCAGGR